MARLPLLYGRIYLIRNLITGKVYVGKTRRLLDHRWKEHLRQMRVGRNALYKAMRKHGAASFCIEEIEVTFATTKHALDKKLNILEQACIQTHNSVSPNGYNLTLGGDGGETSSRNAYIRKYGFRRGAQEWEIERVLRSNRVSGENNPFWGKTHTPEVRRLLSSKLRGRKYSDKYTNPEHVKNLRRQARLGSSLSDTTKNKIRETKLQEKNPQYVRISFLQIAKLYYSGKRVEDIAKTLNVGQGVIKSRLKELLNFKVIRKRKKTGHLLHSQRFTTKDKKNIQKFIRKYHGKTN